MICCNNMLITENFYDVSYCDKKRYIFGFNTLKGFSLKKDAKDLTVFMVFASTCENNNK